MSDEPRSASSCSSCGPAGSRAISSPPRHPPRTNGGTSRLPESWFFSDDSGNGAFAASPRGRELRPGLGSGAGGGGGRRGRGGRQGVGEVVAADHVGDAGGLVAAFHFDGDPGDQVDGVGGELVQAGGGGGGPGGGGG